MKFGMDEPFAILPAAIAPIVMVASGKATTEEINGNESIPQPYLLSFDGRPMSADAGPQPGMIAVIPLVGPVSPDGIYGGTSLRAFTKAVLQADANPNIAKIILHITSPGGTVTGTPEAADAVRQVRERGQTIIVSHADGMMASAATWIGTAASQVSISPSGEAGSIGVISIYAEMSRMLEEAGISVNVIRNPDGKARFTGLEPLTDAMRETMEKRNQAAYSQFKRAMAINRTVADSEVESRFGGGEMLDATEAKAAGLVDKIETFDHMLARVIAGNKQRAPRQRSSELAALEIESVS